MSLNWQWPTAFRWFTAIRDPGAAWQLRPHLLKSRFPDFLLQRWNVALQEEVPWLSPLHPVGEASSGCVKGEASTPCVFTGSQRWFTELACSRASYHLLSLPEPTDVSHSSSSSLSLPPLVREPSLLSQWVTNKSTDIDVLCGWMVPPVLNCCYCNYEAHPASLREYVKRQLPYIVLNLTEIGLLWLVCNMKFWCPLWV